MSMEGIEVWLRQIMVVVMIAGFLDLLLPDNQLKGVTRLVMGLLVLIILIQPFTHIFRIALEPAWSLPPMTSVASSEYWETDALVERGLNLRRRWETVYQQENRTGLEREIRLILNRDGLGKLNQLDLDITAGQPRKAKIHISTKQSLSSHKDLHQKINAEIILQVNRFTGLEEKQIEVIWDEPQ